MQVLASSTAHGLTKSQSEDSTNWATITYLFFIVSSLLQWAQEFSFPMQFLVFDF